MSRASRRRSERSSERPDVWLTVVIPSPTTEDPGLLRLLGDLGQQTFPKHRLEILVATTGSSEEARNRGIRHAQGHIIACLDTDNWLPTTDFLQRHYEAALTPGVTGAYPGRYAYRRSDPSLTRYFALLGANDPVAWWLKKADRDSALDPVAADRTIHFSTGRIPTLGSNGFFAKRSCIHAHAEGPRGHIDVCEAMREAGHFTYVITEATIGHATGDCGLGSYLAKRLRYARAHYWHVRHPRRWRMVASVREVLSVLGFAVSSLLVLPSLWVSCRGARRVPDRAWLWHPAVCLSLTCVYTWLTLEASLSRWWSVPTNVRRP